MERAKALLSPPMGVARLGRDMHGSAEESADGQTALGGTATAGPATESRNGPQLDH